MRKCDVIIPVYNAYDCVKSCVESVMKNTDFRYARLILIDDRSTDPRIVPLLKGYAKEYAEKVIFLGNKKNLGFVGTVNKGMKYSENDVLLLNSDTEVPDGWLERLQECAYSGEMIATATPISNNATLASVPKIFERNRLPDGYDLERMNAVVRKYSMDLRPEIPTAHGFCMYIKRELLRKVGFFDEKTFGRGYGEENDFCFRCMRMGYRHVLCDDVYVLHKESQSFLDAKEDHQKNLMKKHPDFTALLHEWCMQGGISIIGKNISLGLGVEEARPNVLIIIHNFASFGGGTELHVLDLIRILRKKYNFHVLSFEDGLYKVRSFFKETDVTTAVYQKPMDLSRRKLETDLAPGELYSNGYAKILQDVLFKYKICFVHVHHMYQHYFDIIDVCKENGLKYAVSLHDVYLYFPIANRVTDEVNSRIESPVDLKAWRGACAKLMKNAEYVIAPSEETRKKYRKIYRNQDITVVRHGIDLEKNFFERTKRGKVKNIAFVGGIGLQKGSEILERLLPVLEKRGGIKIHLFGATTAQVNNSRIFVDHGVYDRKELPILLNDAKIDLVCNFSLIFETYAYVVDEVAACGVPVLIFDFGASAERVKNNDLGWTMEYTDNVEKIADKIEEIFADEDSYQKVAGSIMGYETRSVFDMANDYNRFYEVFAKEEKLDYEKLKEGIMLDDMMVVMAKKIKRYDEKVCNYKVAMEMRSREALEKEYSNLICSLRWRIISKVSVPKWLSNIIRNMRGVDG